MKFTSCIQILFLLHILHNESFMTFVNRTEINCGLGYGPNLNGNDGKRQIIEKKIIGLLK